MRVEKINGDELYNPDTNAVVVMVPGIFGDRREFGKFDRTARGLYYANIGSLRFDPPTPVTVGDYVDKLRAKIGLLKDMHGDLMLGILAYSSGAPVAAKAYDSATMATVFWAPNTTAWELKKDRIVEENDGLWYTPKGRNHRVPIGRELEREVRETNQGDFLTVKSPTLIIHGNRDDYNPDVPQLRDSRALLNLRSQADLVSVLTIPHDNHYLQKEVDHVVELTVKWFYNYLRR